MKSTSALIPLLALLNPIASAKDPKDLYLELCPRSGPGNGSKDIGGGKTMEWTCDVKPDGLDPYVNPSPTAESPQACAELCKNGSGGECKFGLWLYNKNVCQLFNAEKDHKKQRAAVIVSIKSTEEEDDSPVTMEGDCDDMENSLKDCEESEKELEKELEECKKNQEDGGDCTDVENWYKECQQSEEDLNNKLKECNKGKEECDANLESIKGGAQNLDNLITECAKDKEQCQSDLSNCKDSQNMCEDSDVEQLVEDMDTCPDMDGKQRKVGRVTYTIHCNQGVAKGVKVLRSEPLYFAQCLSACSKDRNCQGVNWWLKSKKRCTMFSEYNPALSARGASQLIAAIPTKKK